MPVDLYDNAYAHYDVEVYRDVRAETYGEDLGQTSWVTTRESEEIPRSLRLTPSSYVLEIGCGSGRYALQVAESVDCRILGLDTNGPGIRTANQLAAAQNLSAQVRFEICDASQALPFGDASFDAAFANDVLCHIPGRAALLHELFRVLTPHGRLLFSDALIIGGAVSQVEIAARSSIGYYSFSPPGENERMIQQAGFRIVNVSDRTENAALIAKRWHNARARRKEALVKIEGETNFDGLQNFLSTVHVLTQERRLLRKVYLAEKLGKSVTSI